jgi:hypothetical protein
MPTAARPVLTGICNREAVLNRPVHGEYDNLAIKPPKAMAANSIKSEGTTVMQLDITALEALPARDDEEGPLGGARTWGCFFSGCIMFSGW